jgi:hypothetical protein
MSVERSDMAPTRRQAGRVQHYEAFLSVPHALNMHRQPSLFQLAGPASDEKNSDQV